MVTEVYFPAKQTVKCEHDKMDRLQFTGQNFCDYILHYEETKLTWMRLKLICHIAPDLAGMNLSPHLSFCGDVNGLPMG